MALNKWYAIHTHAKSEEKARFHLLRQAYHVYLPKYAKQRRHARKVDTIKVPLFPRYLFVKLDINATAWGSINSTVGVLNMVCNGSTPVPLPDDVVEEIMGHEDDNGVVAVGRISDFKKGDPVRIMGGPFIDQLGIFDVSDDGRRVMVLLTLLGRHVRAKLAPEFIEPATV